MLPALARLAPAPGICSLPSRDWPPLRCEFKPRPLLIVTCFTRAKRLVAVPPPPPQRPAPPLPPTRWRSPGQWRPSPRPAGAAAPRGAASRPPPPPPPPPPSPPPPPRPRGRRPAPASAPPPEGPKRSVKPLFKPLHHWRIQFSPQLFADGEKVPKLRVVRYYLALGVRQRGLQRLRRAQVPARAGLCCHVALRPCGVQRRRQLALRLCPLRLERRPRRLRRRRRLRLRRLHRRLVRRLRLSQLRGEIQMKQNRN
eukprot:1192640-Prorocentrum_minimum.AAC.2